MRSIDYWWRSREFLKRLFMTDIKDWERCYTYLISRFNKTKSCFCTQMSCFDYISFPACDGVLLQKQDTARWGLTGLPVWGHKTWTTALFEETLSPYWLQPQSCEQHWQWSHQHEPLDLYTKQGEKRWDYEITMKQIKIIMHQMCKFNCFLSRSLINPTNQVKDKMSTILHFGR